ncbi:MAG: hypothetical protein ACTS8S_00075 [Giesbergeria sp.]
MYTGIRRIFSLYWTAYGGSSALLRSPYLHVAILLLALTWNTWWSPSCLAGAACSAWWDQSIAVLPNLLGFTLGGFAIFIGFGDEKFRALLADPRKVEEAAVPLSTIYVELCASFVHFILIQALAVLFAVVAKAWWFYTPFVDPVRNWLPYLNGVAGAFGYGLFLYALTSVVAATMHVFRIANMYATFRRVSKQSELG